jgi:hypothetical protein
MRQEILKGGADGLRLSLTEHGRAVVPSACSARIVHLGTLLEQGAAAGGIYTPGAATVGQVRQDVAIEWTYTVSGEARKHVELFDVVLFKLYPMASEADLLNEAPSLVESARIHRGTVSSASAAGIIDSELIGDIEDYTGAVLTMRSGVDAGSQYIITGFTSSTGALAFTPTHTPVAGDVYTIRKSFQFALDTAWENIYDRLILACSNAPGGIGDRASRPYLIMTPDRLRRPQILRALEIIFRGIADDQNGADWARADYYAKEYEAAWSGIRLVFAFDSDSSEPAAESESSAQFGFHR